MSSKLLKKEFSHARCALPATFITYLDEARSMRLGWTPQTSPKIYRGLTYRGQAIFCEAFIGVVLDDIPRATSGDLTAAKELISTKCGIDLLLKTVPRSIRYHRDDYKAAYSLLLCAGGEHQVHKLVENLFSSFLPVMKRAEAESVETFVMPAEAVSEPTCKIETATTNHIADRSAGSANRVADNTGVQGTMPVDGPKLEQDVDVESSDLGTKVASGDSTLGTMADRSRGAVRQELRSQDVEHIPQAPPLAPVSCVVSLLHSEEKAGSRAPAPLSEGFSQLSQHMLAIRRPLARTESRDMRTKLTRRDSTLVTRVDRPRGTAPQEPQPQAVGHIPTTPPTLAPASCAASLLHSEGKAGTRVLAPLNEGLSCSQPVSARTQPSTGTDKENIPSDHPPKAPRAMRNCYPQVPHGQSLQPPTAPRSHRIRYNPLIPSPARQDAKDYQDNSAVFLGRLGLSWKELDFFRSRASGS
ncbi:hypothetical protein DXG01_007102 [Tephrocybe rancida]|nr:hypothetical protein DXG01_007102 [Tephrocybe rancida]